MHRVIKLELPASISFGSTGSNPVAVDIVFVFARLRFGNDRLGNGVTFWSSYVRS